MGNADEQVDTGNDEYDREPEGLPYINSVFIRIGIVEEEIADEQSRINCSQNFRQFFHAPAFIFFTSNKVCGIALERIGDRLSGEMVQSRKDHKQGAQIRFMQGIDEAHDRVQGSPQSHLQGKGSEIGGNPVGPPVFDFDIDQNNDVNRQN